MLRYADILPNLEKITSEMKKSELEIDVVGHIGNKICFLGNYFANFFNCLDVEFPSLFRPERNPFLAHIANKIYPFLPELALKPLSKQYKRLYRRDKRILIYPFNLEKITSGHKSLLLVDDNSFTGKTFEEWKKIIDGKINIHTFSITVTDDYRPDYFCIEGWRSFEWRPIGI